MNTIASTLPAADQQRANAVREATRIYRQAREDAMDAYFAGGGTDESLRAPMHLKIGEPLYDSLVMTVTAAAMEYRRAIEAAYAAHRAETQL